MGSKNNPVGSSIDKTRVAKIDLQPLVPIPYNRNLEVVILSDQVKYLVTLLGSGSIDPHFYELLPIRAIYQVLTVNIGKKVLSRFWQEEEKRNRFEIV